MRKHILNILNLGIEPYRKIWDFQHQLHSLRLQNKINDVLILLEHDHVFTLGKVAKREHLLIPEAKLNEKKIDLFEIDRGGDITYHGPGQIVGYPIIKLDELYQDLHRYLRELEEVIILTLKDYNIEGTRIDGLTGVWIEDEKIAAIGIKVSRWITMHGFAFNINTDLNYFNMIIPCGIQNKGVTSLKKLTGREFNINEIKDKLTGNFVNLFRYDEVNKFYSIEEFSQVSSKILMEGN